MVCQMCSMRRGSCPMTRTETSSMAPTTLLVFHSRVASPHPQRPGWSVSTFTKIQLRMRAFTTVLEIFVIFIAGVADAITPQPGAHVLCFAKYLVIAYGRAYNNRDGFGPRAYGISGATGIARARHGEPSVHSRHHGACGLIHGS